MVPGSGFRVPGSGCRVLKCRLARQMLHFNSLPEHGTWNTELLVNSCSPYLYRTGNINKFDFSNKPIPCQQNIFW